MCVCRRKVSYFERGRDFVSPLCALWWPLYNFLSYNKEQGDWTTTRVGLVREMVCPLVPKEWDRGKSGMKYEATGRRKDTGLHCVMKVHYGTGLQEQNRNHSEILQYGCCHALREGLKTVLVTSSHMMSKTQEARRQYANEFYLKRLFPSQRRHMFHLGEDYETRKLF